MSLTKPQRRIAPPKKPVAKAAGLIYAFDTELTSLDLWHGGLPFSMQACCSDGTTYFAEWDVDPFTRIPDIKVNDVIRFREKIDNAITVLHNAKIDIRALEAAKAFLSRHGKNILKWEPWNWSNIQDTHIKSHALRNLWSHSLKDLRDIFFNVSRDKQQALKIATDQARKICRSKEFIAAHGTWRIADDGDPHWPGITRAPKEKDDDIEGWWLFDTWLPKTIYRLAPEFLPPQENTGLQYVNGYHPWATVLKEYAIEDVETTLVLNTVLDEALEAEGLTTISQQRHELLEITWDMEQYGVYMKTPIFKSELARYQTETDKGNIEVKAIAAQYELEDFNPASDKQLRSLLYDKWSLPILRRTDPSKTFPEGQAGTDADTLEKLSDLLKESPNSHLGQTQSVVRFLDFLLKKNANETCVNYLSNYWGWSVLHGPARGRRIHSNINIVGTKFTRQATSSPNLQNVGTGDDVYDEEGNKTGEIDFLTRVVFGPPPGREWLSIDFQSIEFFIWGFSCGNEEIKRVYESGESPFKPVMEAVWGFFDKEDKKYKKTKNGIYSILYGARESHSDKTFGREGAVKAVIARLPEVRTFTSKLHKQVRSKGYIETIGGYRLYIPPDEPHKAVSGFVQGHAGWVIGRAMVACYNYLRNFPDLKLILQIHDELIIEGPTGFAKTHATPLANEMRQSGEQFGIPTPVNKSLIVDNWGEAVAL